MRSFSISWPSIEQKEYHNEHQSQGGLTNFYPPEGVNPYVAVAAAGPWIVTLKGAVVYDCGGYGMLGLGHCPGPILDAMNQPHVMANVMTPSISQNASIQSSKRQDLLCSWKKNSNQSDLTKL